MRDNGESHGRNKGASPARREAPERRHREERATALDHASVKRPSYQAPVSFAQERLWFLDQLEPGDTSYNVPFNLRLTGTLDIGALRRSINEIVRRHDILRTTFPAVDGRPVQSIAPALELDLVPRVLDDLPPKEGEAHLRDLVSLESERSFDLARGPLIRASIVRLSDEEHVLLLTMHHIVCDGWSMQQLMRELTILYGSYTAGKPSPLEALPLQYADYASWQRRFLDGPTFERQLAYWRERLAGAPPHLALPIDRPRREARVYRGEVERFHLARNLVRSLNERCRLTGTTPFMRYLAVFSILLSRYGAVEDVLIGVPAANRNRLRESERMIGFFVNTLVLRIDLSGNPTFMSLLERVRGTVIGALAHQDLPFEKLVQELQPVRERGVNPLFQVGFAHHAAPASVSELPGLLVTPLSGNRVTPGVTFDLNLSLIDDGTSLTGGLEYNKNLFNTRSITAMAAHLRNLFAEVAANPESRLSALTMLSPTEHRRIVTVWNATGREYDDVRIHRLFEDRVDASPDAIAVTAGTEHLTYGGLNRRANMLARHLISRGIDRESIVGVFMERSTELVTALLAVQKAGGAYLPLDPDLPVRRIAQIAEEARPAVILTQTALAPSLADTCAECIPVDGSWDKISLHEDVNVGTIGTAAVWGIARRAAAPEDAARETAPGTDRIEAAPENAAYVIYTSGSTGRPKGVVNTHGGLTNRLLWMQETFALSPADRVLQKTPFGFDVSVWEFFWPLMVGARLVMARPGGHRDAAYLAETITGESITTLHFVPSMLDIFLEEGRTEARTSLRRVISSGEVLTPALAERFLDRSPADLYNLYGPTEASIDVTSWQCQCGDDRPSVPIGRPIANTRIYLLDGGLHPVPPGITGELQIAGRGIARGYLGRPGMTADRFIPDPLCERPGERMYRSGDLARYLPAGDIDYMGRTDGQVKIRGFRIELGEIEEALRRHPHVRDSAVTVRHDPRGDAYIIAYIVPAEGSAPEHLALRLFLEETLPSYMVPAAFVAVERMPLTPSGKIDLRALPAPDRARPDLLAPFAAPRTPTQEVIAGIFADVLDIERIGVHDNFFELGGHSLLAARVASRIRTLFHVDLPLGRIFDTPNVAGLAHAVESAGRADRIPPIPRIERRDAHPLSFAQQRLWFIHQLDPAATAYNLVSVLRMKGPLDVRALEHGMQGIVRRHESLRTIFNDVNGNPSQVLSPEASLRLETVDLRGHPANEREKLALQLASREARRPFDLAYGPLVRTFLLRVDDEQHILFICIHHIVSDGWSMEVFLREVSTLYRERTAGRTAALPELPCQYIDFAEWQRSKLVGNVLRAQLAYWKDKLAGMPTALELPTDRRRPPVQGTNGAHHAFTVPAVCAGALRELGRREGATLFMTLLAAFETLLFRYTYQTDLVVGTPVAGRDRTEIEGLIGFFVNTLVLRTDLSGNPSFRELLARVRDTAIEAFIHQDLPFEKLVDELRPARDMSRHPLFQVLFALQSEWGNRPEFPGLTVEPLTVETGTAKFDLMLVMSDSPDRMEGWFEYSTDLFAAETIAGMAEHFVRILAGITADPECGIAELPLLADDERNLVTIEWNRTSRQYTSGACLHELFEERTAEAPDGIAAVHRDENITFGELNHRSNALAGRLIAHGVGAETPVGLCLNRSIEMIIGMLAVLKAGGAYIPLDPAYPEERLSRMAADADLRMILTERALLAHLAGAIVTADDTPVDLICLDEGRDTSAPDKGNRRGRCCADNTAYVIYTSGSTGHPKGVCCTHEGAVNLFADFNRRLPASGTGRCSFWTKPDFDVSVYEIFMSLVNGDTLNIIPEETRLDALAFIEWLAERGITGAYIPPMMLEDLDEWLDRGGRLPALRSLLVGVEPIEERLLSSIGERLPGLTVINGYGPTETTICATLYTVPPGPAGGGNAPIGTPVQNSQIYILDRYLSPVPIGVPGEVYIAGPGLARCYRHRADLTAASFIPNHLGGSGGTRLYRTGDIARYRTDGNIVFIGRADRQVKISGFRIEPGEIEAALRAHPAVRDAAVAARDDMPGGRGLAAYIVTHGGRNVTPGDVRSFLRRSLPDYMVPQAVVRLDALPITPSGKLDRSSLPAPAMESTAAFTAPRSETERTIAAAWRAVLGIDTVGVHDNFFDIGGNSLLLAQLRRKLETRFRIDISMVDMFRHPTVSALSRRLRHEEKERPSSGRIEERAAKKRTVLEAKRSTMRKRRA